MVKFYRENLELGTYDKYFTVVEEESSPFKEILQKGDFSSLSFQLDNSEKMNQFSDLFTFRVNITNSASFFFLFDKTDFKKEELSNKITTLKEKEVIDVRSAKEKTFALLDIVRDYNPIFVIYVPRKGIHLYENEVRYVLFDTHLEFTPAFYIRKSEEELEDASVQKQMELPPKEKGIKSKFNIKKPNIPLPKITGNKFKDILAKLAYFFKGIPGAIKENKYHYLFLIVSAFLLGFSSSIGLFNAILGKSIAALFFVCALVGAALNTFIYMDFLKRENIKSLNFCYSVVSNLLGAIFSIVGFVIFYAVDTSENKTSANQGMIIGLGLLILLVFVAITILIAYFVTKRKKKE